MPKTYEVFQNATGKVVKTLTAEWSEVIKVIHANPGTSARKAVYVPVTAENDIQLSSAAAHYEMTGVSLLEVFVDCLTSGNPGPGGYKVVLRDKTILKQKMWEDAHTNNYYEIAAIGAGIRYLIDNFKGGKCYTDSKICMGWLSKGTVSAKMLKEQPVYAAQLNKIITAINVLNNDRVELLYISGGENPADDGRRVH